MNQQKIIVSGILENNGMILLAKRPMTKTIAPGKWHLPGGHVEFGESPDDALIREFYEEFHLRVEAGAIVRTFSYVVDDVHTVGITYRVFCAAIPGILETDQNDTESVAWVSLRNIGRYLAVTDHDYVTLMKLAKIASV